MSYLIQLLRESLPEAIGALAAAAILAILGLLYRWSSRRKKERPLAGIDDVKSTTRVRHRPPIVQSAQKQSLLVVDDDIEIIAPVFRPLEREGFEIIAATNVSQAMDILQSDQKIDLIVTDIILPYGDEKAGEA